MAGLIKRFIGAIAAAYLDVADLAYLGQSAVPVFAVAGAPSNGTSGTLAGIAGPGLLLVDVTNKTFYQNTNTKASPTWTALTTATGAGTYTGTFDGLVGSITPAAGVFTTLAASGLITVGAAATVTAHAGGTQAAALALTKQFNKITTCATAGDSVKLPASAAGLLIVITNEGAAAAQVFGASTDTIDGVTTATGVPLAVGASAIYHCEAAGKWRQVGQGVLTGTFDGIVGATTPAAGSFTTGAFSGLLKLSVADALTASLVQTRAGGTALTKQINRVATAAVSGDAVTLPALTAGQYVDVYNDAANPISVFPNGASDTIDGGSGGAAVALANAKRCRFTCVAANTIISAQLGAVSA